VLACKWIGVGQGSEKLHLQPGPQRLAPLPPAGSPATAVDLTRAPRSISLGQEGFGWAHVHAVSGNSSLAMQHSPASQCVMQFSNRETPQTLFNQDVTQARGRAVAIYGETPSFGPFRMGREAVRRLTSRDAGLQLIGLARGIAYDCIYCRRALSQSFLHWLHSALCPTGAVHGESHGPSAILNPVSLSRSPHADAALASGWLRALGGAHQIQRNCSLEPAIQSAKR